MYWAIVCLFLCVAKAKAACNNPSITTASGTHAPKGEICSGDLIFEDNFDDLDLKVWQHENTMGSGGNWEFQYYTNNRTVSYAQWGNLYIKPHLITDETGYDWLYYGTMDLNDRSPADECTNHGRNGCVRTGTSDIIINPIKSARIRTFHSFSFKYGKVEVNAKLPAGDWIWPAIWMLPRDNTYARWPASGEIDLMESRGNRYMTNGEGVNIGIQRVECNMHWGPNYMYDRNWDYTHWDVQNDEGWDKNFHRYQVEWTPDHITISIDDKEVGTLWEPETSLWEWGRLHETGLQNPWRFSKSKMAPFDQEFYIILNVAVGSIVYFPDNNMYNPGGKPWLNTSPRAITDFWEARDQWIPTWNLETDDSAMQVDYVRVWAL